MDRQNTAIKKIAVPDSVKQLFSDWEESLIWSALQGVMGDIYADCGDCDDQGNPTSALIVLGDFAYFAGKPNTELIKYLTSMRNFIIIVPQNEEWAAAVELVCGETAEKRIRYAIKKEPGIFDETHLQQLASLVPEGYTLRRIDRELYEECGRLDWARDFVAQFPTYAEYAEMGLGFVLMKGSEVVAGVSSYSAYKGGIEIEIITKEEYRRRGFAAICGARIILECMSRGLYPSWDAENKWSAALAEKLGYHFSHEYVSYRVGGDTKSPLIIS